MNRHTRPMARHTLVMLALLLGLVFAGTGLLRSTDPVRADGQPTPTATPAQPTGGEGDPNGG